MHQHQHQHQYCAAVIGTGPLTDAVARRLASIATVARVNCDLADVGILVDAIAAADVLFVDLPVDLDDPDCLKKAVNSAKSVVRASELSAASTGGRLRHVVYTTATSPLKVVGIAARHLDALAFADELWQRSESRLAMTRLLLPQLLHSTAFLGQVRIGRVAGQPVLALPTGSVPVDTLDEEDAAAAVVTSVQRTVDSPSDCRIRCLPMSAGKLTAAQMAQQMGEELGVEIFERRMAFVEFRQRPHPSALDWSNGLEFAVRVDQQLKRSVTEQAVPGGVTSFRDWCRKHKGQLLEAIAC